MVQITKLTSKEVRAIVAKHYGVPIDLVFAACSYAP